jgi:hypothetical protein
MKTNTHFLSYLVQFFSEWEIFRQRKQKHTLYVQELVFDNRAAYEIMWKNTVEPDRTQMTIWRMRIACWSPKATNTHSEYVILIDIPLK